MLWLFLFVLLFEVLLHRFYDDRFRESVHPRHVLKKLLCFALIIWGVVLILA